MSNARDSGGKERSRGRLLRHIPELDGLRGLAALAVFFHHVCGTTVQAEARWSAWTQGVHIYSGLGNTGVDVFFVLSGFLITSILLNERERSEYYAPFYWKRVLRIVPVYVCVLLYVVLFVPHSALAAWCALFFVANFSLLAHAAPIAPFWSLAIEEQFYLVWPTLVRKRDPQRLMVWAIGIALGSILSRVLFALRGHYDYYLTFLHCDGLAEGALLACLYVRRDVAPRTMRGVVAGAWGAGILLWMMRTVPAATAMQAALALTAVTLMSLGLVGTLVLRTGSRWLGLFRSRVLVYFGLISYAFYLVHLYVLRAYDARWGLYAGASEGQFWLRFGAVLGATVLLATVSRYAMELPVQRLRRYIPVLQTRAARAEEARVSA